MAQQPLRQIVRRGDMVVSQEDSPAALVFEDLRADAARLAGGWSCGGQGEEARDPGLVLGYLVEQLSASQPACGPFRPGVQDPSGSRAQTITVPSTGTPTLDHRLEVPSRCAQQNW